MSYYLLLELLYECSKVFRASVHEARGTGRRKRLGGNLLDEVNHRREVQA